MPARGTPVQDAGRSGQSWGSVVRQNASLLQLSAIAPILRTYVYERKRRTSMGCGIFCVFRVAEEWSFGMLHQAASNKVSMTIPV